MDLFLAATGSIDDVGHGVGREADLGPVNHATARDVEPRGSLEVLDRSRGHFREIELTGRLGQRALQEELVHFPARQRGLLLVEPGAGRSRFNGDHGTQSKGQGKRASGEMTKAEKQPKST